MATWPGLGGFLVFAADGVAAGAAAGAVVCAKAVFVIVNDDAISATARMAMLAVRRSFILVVALRVMFFPWRP
jgi:hypothetical protein